MTATPALTGWHSLKLLTGLIASPAAGFAPMSFQPHRRYHESSGAPSTSPAVVEGSSSSRIIAPAARHARLSCTSRREPLILRVRQK
eukprot:scaffold201533_cov32-Tisochrysis_lutea.AAC.1